MMQRWERRVTELPIDRPEVPDHTAGSTPSVSPSPGPHRPPSPEGAGPGPSEG
jgi:hypothetical protein